jgi:hypothetical protein
MNSWHRIEAWRTGRGGILKVDEQSWIENIAKDSFGLSSKNDSIFIGGAPIESLPEILRDLSGFHGCIKQVR